MAQNLLEDGKLVGQRPDGKALAATIIAGRTETTEERARLA
jgi:transcription initiation factor TFIIIB Brf1 subunit/transcription initiation factor TFIIB